ncbi:MarR family winged helix-turn-helix transcriptional regulator [Xanthobacter agilis]|uniref:DNA-binding MarR family transcriptional regulator n=1 Tax=Xanthobacter agilis TaxID=47492 RepID=A0ABU0LK66_XANAG|nr:MarR family transcriptional regulator [Xanthobacter agilis]MDQ0507537.1 DNA-binding MarR family transcriptional regulator [Xanthobacter agilis]
MEEALKPLGLNPAQYAVLAELDARPDQTNADLAERAFITPQSMQGVRAKLEESRLVERRQDVRHGRRQLARLTPEGHVKAEAANAEVMRVEEVLEAAVHPDAIQDALI